MERGVASTWASSANFQLPTCNFTAEPWPAQFLLLRAVKDVGLPTSFCSAQFLDVLRWLAQRIFLLLVLEPVSCWNQVSRVARGLKGALRACLGYRARNSEPVSSLGRILSFFSCLRDDAGNVNGGLTSTCADTDSSVMAPKSFWPRAL